MLIDLCASHNFISWALVEELQFPISLTHEFGIVRGTSNEV